MQRHPALLPAARMFGLVYWFFTSHSARSYSDKLARNTYGVSYAASIQRCNKLQFDRESSDLNGRGCARILICWRGS